MEQTWKQVPHCGVTCMLGFGDYRIIDWDEDHFSPSWAILTNFCGTNLQFDNMEDLIFVNKNWLNDPTYGCNASKIMGEVVDLKVDLG